MRRIAIITALIVTVLTPHASQAAESRAEKFNAMTPVQKEDFMRAYLPRRGLLNLAMSGEGGHLNRNGTLNVVWKLDYAGENDTRPTLGEGAWNISRGALTITGTSISDGTFSIGKFRAFTYKRRLVLSNCAENSPLLGTQPSWRTTLTNADRLALSELQWQECQ